MLSKMAILCFLGSMYKMFEDLNNDYIICASKYFTTDDMRKIYQLGIRHFGENRSDDLLDKKLALSDLQITWHFIGHLQTNKVKKVINNIDVLHSLSSMKLAEMIQKYRIDALDCFIQVNLTNETHKNGIYVHEIPQFIRDIQKYDKINLLGFMTIGQYNDSHKTKVIFDTLYQLKKQFKLEMTSMGMSGDYRLTSNYENNYVRIGSLFKEVI